jgi:hypothetical protein
MPIWPRRPPEGQDPKYPKGKKTKPAPAISDLSWLNPTPHALVGKRIARARALERADAPHSVDLLRTRRERPGECRPAERTEKFVPPHVSTPGIVRTIAL